MHPDTMRRIDRWVGIPLCAVASLLLPWLAPHKPSNSTAPDTVVLICIAEIGALLVAHPAIVRARKLFPESRLCFITGPGGKGALEVMGFPDEDILILRTDSFPELLADGLKLRNALSKAGVVHAAVLEPFTRFSHLVSTWVGAERRSGCHRFHNEGGYLGSLVTNPVVFNSHLHASQTYVVLVEALAEGASSEPGVKQVIPSQIRNRARFQPPQQQQQALQERIVQQAPELDGKRLVLLNANASDIVPLRKWPLERFAEVGQRLLQECNDVGIILTGTPAEQNMCTQLAEQLDSRRVLSLAGQTTFPELLTLYTLGTLLVTNDSGPVHFASSTNIPILALYGPEHPAVFGPMSPKATSLYLGLACSPCITPYNQKKSSCTHNRCLLDITVEMVLEHARKFLV